ncbi:hypothetical protein ACJIZ3_019980 [Penstemon smallii]|uniref:Uncharacterized protein n=1 Tax=Penstemon smallii TaxID=265156 RepID=A0ABD3T3Z2_9LAMI
MIDKKEREIAKIIMKNNSFPLRMHESPLRGLRAKVDDTRSLIKQMDVVKWHLRSQAIAMKLLNTRNRELQ